MNLKNKLIYNQNKGFTLIELSVVLIIISLIIAGVISGANLINNTKLRLVIKEVRELESFIINFETKFKYLPGDYPNGAIQLGGGIANGDGNWQISRDESAAVARSLTLSGETNKQYATSSGDLVLGENMFKSSVNSGGYWFVTHQSGLGSNVGSVYGKSSESIDLAFYTDANNFRNGLLTSNDSIYIDNKIDDGLASSGYVYASVGQDFDDTNGCVDALPSATSANYLPLRDTHSCRLHFWYDRK